MPQRESNAVDGFLRSLPAEALVVEIGSGRGHFVSAHPRIVATDYSLYALHQFCGGGPRIHLDAQLLPFRDESIDAFFSVATLEHVPDPARALAEIDRCLAVNGSVLMFPAWLVFPWLGKDLERRPFRELSLRDRLRKLTIPVRKRPLYRFLRVLPRRLLREGRALRRLAVPFDFDELEPNFETYLTSDSDAFTSMDPHACATFFRSRGYVVDGCETFRRRLMLRYVPIVAHKVAPRRAATGCDGGAN
jgi:SAM-dependent methyltransferase